MADFIPDQFQPATATQELPRPTGRFIADEGEAAQPSFVYDEETDSNVGVPAGMNEIEAEHVIKVGVQSRDAGQFLGGSDVVAPIDHQTRAQAEADLEQMSAKQVSDTILGFGKGALRYVTYDLPQSVTTILENQLRSGALRPATMKEAGIDRSYWGVAADKQADAVKALQVKHEDIMRKVGLVSEAPNQAAGVTEDIGAVGGQIAVQLGLGVLTGNPVAFGMAMGGVLTMADQLKKAQEAGATPEDAFSKSLLPTALVGWLEGIGNGALTRAVTKNVRVGKYISSMAEWMKARPFLNPALIGTAQEASQQVVTEAWEKLNQWDDDTVQEIAGSVVYAGVLGFVTMGAIGAVTVTNVKESLRNNPAFQDLTPQEQDIVVGELLAKVESNEDGILDEGTAIVSRQADPKLLGYSDPALLEYSRAKQQIEIAKGDTPSIVTTPKEDVMRDGDGFERKTIKYRKQAIATELTDVTRQIIGLENDYQKAIDPKTQGMISVARNVGKIETALTKLDEAYKALETIGPEVKETVRIAQNKATYASVLPTEQEIASKRARARELIEDLRTGRITGNFETRVADLNALAAEIMALAQSDVRGAKTAAGLRDTQTRDLIRELKSEISALRQDRTLLKSLNTKPNAKLGHSLYKKIADLKRRRLLLAREDALLTFANHWEQENPVVQLTLEQFTKDAQVEFSKRVVAFRDGLRKGIKEGSKQTQQSIKDVQTEFTKFIQDSVPRAYAWKLVAKIKDANTPERMERLMARVQKQIDLMDRKIVFNEIKALAKGLQKSKNIDIRYLTEINTILAQCGVTHPKTLQARINVLSDSIMAKVAEGTPASLQHIVLQNLWTMTEKKMPDMSMGELSALKGSLEALAEEGRSEQKKYQATLQAYKKEFLQKFSFLGKSPLQKERLVKTLPKPEIFNNLTKVQQFEAIFDKIRGEMMQAPDMLKHGLTRMDMNFLPMEVLMDMFDQGAAYYNGPHIQYIWKPMNQGFSRYLDTSYSTNEQTRQLAQKLKLDENNFVRIGVYAALRQEGGLDKVLGSGYGQENQIELGKHLKTAEGQKALATFAKQRGIEIQEAEEIILGWAEQTDIKKLTELGLLPEEQAFYDHMQNVFAKIYPSLKEVARVYHNIDLKQINGYFRMDMDFEASHDMLLEDKFAQATGTIVPPSNIDVKKTKTERGMTKERLGGRNAIKLDAYEVLTKYVNDAYYYIHMTPYLEGARTLVKSTEYRSQVGDIPQEYLTDWLDTVARRGGQEGAYHNKILDQIRQNGYLALLSWRASTIALQSTALITAMAELPAATVAMGTGHVWANTAEGSKLRQWLKKEFPTYAARSLDDPALFDNFNQHMLDTLMQGTLAPLAGIKQVDKLTAGAVLFAAYQHYYRLNDLPVPSVKDIISNPPDVNAARYAESIMSRTQGSPYFINLPQVLSRGKGFGGNSSVAKGFLMLGTFNLMVPWRLLRYDGIQAALKRKDIGRAFGVTGAVAGMTLAGNGIKMLLDLAAQNIFPEPAKDDEGDEEVPRGLWDIYKERTAMDAVRTIPFAGNAAAIVVNNRMGSAFLDEFGSMYESLSRARQNQYTVKKQNAKDEGPNEEVVARNEAKALRNRIEALYTAVNWAPGIGSGPLRMIFNEQVKEILLDKYDQAINNME